MRRCNHTMRHRMKMMLSNDKPQLSLKGDVFQQRDEVIVDVYSALGSYCGSFVWPGQCVSMLEELNQYKQGFEFSINK